MPEKMHKTSRQKTAPLPSRTQLVPNNSFLMKETYEDVVKVKILNTARGFFER